MSLKVLTLCGVLAIAVANVIPEVPYHEIPLDVMELPEVPHAHGVPLVDGTPDNPDEVQMPKFHYELEEEVEERFKDVDHPYLPEVPHLPSYVPEVPEVPDVPYVPEVPDVPYVPEVPDVHVPEVPDVPYVPEVPEVPDVPYVPDVHDVPNLPREHEEEVHSHIEKLKKLGQIFAHSVMTHKDTYFPNP